MSSAFEEADSSESKSSSTRKPPRRSVQETYSRRFEAPAPAGELLCDAPQLRVERLRLAAPVEITNPEGASFALYCCVRGGATVQLSLPGGIPAAYAVPAGETLLVPAECTQYRLLPTEPDTVLLETTVRPDTRDPYIDPAAAPTLPEDE